MALLSDILLSNEVLTLLIVDSVLFVLLSIAFVTALIILKNYRKDDSSHQHYQLEKKAYLLSTLISVSVVVKFLLLGFYLYTIDALSTLIPGAMCASGVVTSSSFGYGSFISRALVVLLGLYWLRLNAIDERRVGRVYFRVKLYFFLFIYALLVIEALYTFGFFTSLSSEFPVLCCSVSSTNATANFLPFSLSMRELLSVFGGLFVMILVSNFYKKYLLSFLLSLFFVYISYYCVVYFFGTYIYELPTHHCPFCMLGYDYDFIGYALFLSLFFGLYFSLFNAKFSSYFYLIFMLLVSYKLFLYLYKNGVLITPI